MNVYIATAKPDSIASRALRMEGVEHEELINGDDLDYGRHFTELWNRGKPFVICEDDIIPSPGTVSALLECPQPWCSHRHPTCPGNPLCGGFGFAKHKPVGTAPKVWAETPWWLLDGEVMPFLPRVYGQHAHFHQPDVAHARKVTNS